MIVLWKKPNGKICLNMSLLVIEQPEDVSLSGNPVGYLFRSNNLYNGIFIYPEITITFTAQAGSGEIFTIDFCDPNNGQVISLTFTAVETPADCSNEFYDDTPRVQTPDLATWVDAIALQIQKYPPLNSYYTVESNGTNAITIKARGATAAYAIKNVTTDITGATVDLTNQATFHTPERRPAFLVSVEVWIEKQYNSSHFERVALLTSEPDDLGEVDFDISSILDAEIKRSFNDAPLPDVQSDANNFVTRADVTRKYFIRYSEVYGGLSENQFWQYGDKKLIQHGAVSKEDFPKNAFFSYIQAKEAFLTWMPQGKLLAADQKDFLSWFNFTAGVVVPVINAEVFFTDGTSQLAVLNSFLESFQQQPNEVCHVPVGYTQLDLGAVDPAKTVKAWEIFLVDTTTATTISERRRYILDTSCPVCVEDIVYLTSLCLPEVVRTTGQWQKNLNVQRLFIDAPLQPDYKVVNGKEYQYDREGANTFTARTGYMSKAFAEYFQDFLLYNSAWQLTSEGLIPVLIDGNNFKITECLQFLHTVDFPVRRSIPICDYSAQERIPFLVEKWDCGLEGYTVDSNLKTVTNYGDLTIYDLDGSVLHSVSWNPTTECYEFPSVVSFPGRYQVEVDLTVNGEVLKYRPFHQTRNAEFTFRHNDTFTAFFLQGTEAGIPVYIDFNDGAGWQSFTQGTTILPYGALYGASTAVRNVRVQTPCQEKITLIAWLPHSMTEYNVEAFLGLLILSPFLTSVSGEVNTSFHPQLAGGFFNGNSFTSIDLGLPINVGALNYSGNSIEAPELEEFIFYLWEHRLLFDPTVKVLDLSGNPGSGSISVEADDAINGTDNAGTGKYLGDGLIQNNWLVTI